MCHITVRLNVYELTFSLGGGGANRCLARQLPGKRLLFKATSGNSPGRCTGTLCSHLCEEFSVFLASKLGIILAPHQVFFCA